MPVSLQGIWTNGSKRLTHAMWEMVQVQADITSFCIHYCLLYVLVPKLVHTKLCIEIIAIYFGN